MTLSMIDTVGDVLIWEYAKLISDGISDERISTDAAFQNYLDIKSGAKRFTDPVFEDLEIDREKCAYCGVQKDLKEGTLVPDRGCISSDCHNTVRVCSQCRHSKGDRDLMDWWGLEKIHELHPAVRRKYLRMLYLCYECRGLLDQHIPSNEPDLSDLTQIFKQPCFSFQSKVTRDASGLE